MENNDLYLDIDEKEIIKIKAVETFLELINTDENLSEKYKVYINEYYNLPINNRRSVCNNVYKCFVRDSSIEMDSICTLIAYETEIVEEYREKDCIMDAIKRNIKRIPERPKINFDGVIDE